jgi:hypothetical protein
MTFVMLRRKGIAWLIAPPRLLARGMHGGGLRPRVYMGDGVRGASGPKSAHGGHRVHFCRTEKCARCPPGPLLTHGEVHPVPAVSTFRSARPPAVSTNGPFVDTVGLSVERFVDTAVTVRTFGSVSAARLLAMTSLRRCLSSDCGHLSSVACLAVGSVWLTPPPLPTLSA